MNRKTLNENLLIGILTLGVFGIIPFSFRA